MTYLYLDIETIPAQRPDVLEEIRASKQADLTAALAAVKPPSNYGAEAAAKWWTEKGEAQKAALSGAFDAEVDDTYRKTSFDGGFGQVCVIGFAIDGGPTHQYRVEDLSVEAEVSLLTDFVGFLDSVIPARESLSTTIVGHNVSAFDLRFLVQRYIVNGIRPHIIIARAAQAKPWEQEKVFDTMVQWSGVGGRVSLDKLCKALSISTPKGELDGSMVWDFVKAGALEKVAEYCAKDVAATRSVHRRMTFAA